MGNCCSVEDDDPYLIVRNGENYSQSQLPDAAGKSSELHKPVITPPKLNYNNLSTRSLQHGESKNKLTKISKDNITKTKTSISNIENIQPKIQSSQFQKPQLKISKHKKKKIKSISNVDNNQPTIQPPQSQKPEIKILNQSDKPLIQNLDNRCQVVIDKIDQNLSIPEIDIELQKIKKNEQILEDMLYITNKIPTHRNVSPTHKPYELEVLNSDSLEFHFVKNKFFKTNKPCFKLHKIEKVINPCLIIQYSLKKSEYLQKNIPIKEEMMFHGTKISNIDGICKNNFNWRFRGAAKGFKFGQGVSFSPITYYASHYGDTTYNKVMIAVYVVIASCCSGTKTMIIPPPDCDTSTNQTNQVYVKYEDNTFYPAYVIHYGGIDEQTNKNKTDDQINNSTEENYTDDPNIVYFESNLHMNDQLHNPNINLNLQQQILRSQFRPKFYQNPPIYPQGTIFRLPNEGYNIPIHPHISLPRFYHNNPLQLPNFHSIRHNFNQTNNCSPRFNFHTPGRFPRQF